MLNKSRLFKSSRKVSTTEICSIYGRNNNTSLCLTAIRIPISDTMYHNTMKPIQNAQWFESYLLNKKQKIELIL